MAVCLVVIAQRAACHQYFKRSRRATANAICSSRPLGVHSCFRQIFKSRSNNEIKDKKLAREPGIVGQIKNPFVYAHLVDGYAILSFPLFA